GRVGDDDAGQCVGGYCVAGTRARAADGVVLRVIDEDTVTVGDGTCAGCVRADEVALHDVVVRGAVEDSDAVVVAGDDIARGGGRTADGIVMRHAIDVDTCAIAESGRAGRVRADKVALNDVVTS